MRGLLLFSDVGQLNIIAESLRHFHEGVVHHAIRFLDKAIHMGFGRPDVLRDLCPGGFLLYALYLYIDFNVVTDLL